MARKSVLAKINFKYLGIALFLIAGSIAIGYYISSSVIIRDVAVHGSQMSDKDEIIDFLNNRVIGIHADSLNLNEIKNDVESRSYVKQSRIFISPTGRMTIEITEREPLALIMQGDSITMVDFEGVKMPIPNGNVPDLPLLFGFNALPLSDTLSTDAFKVTAEFLNTLKQHPLAFITISEVGWHKENGVVALSREQDITLIFGFENFQNRLEYWSGFYRDVAPRKGLASYRSLDFRYKGQIIAKNS